MPAPPIAPRQARLRLIVLVTGLAAAIATALFLGSRAARTTRLKAGLPPVPTRQINPTLLALMQPHLAAAADGRLEAVAELGTLYHANEFRSEAEACWRLLAREDPGNARWHYYLADLLRHAGNQEGMEAELEATVRADPSAAIAWLQLAETKLKSGRIGPAMHDYRQRLKLLPGDPYARLGLARAALLQGQRDDARQQLEQLLRDQAKFPAAQNLYAELLSAAGQEDSADYHRWLGREAGRFREAEDPWMLELDARCHDARRLCHLGVIAYQTGQLDRARELFAKAIRVDPGFTLAYELLGTLRLEQGSTEEARDWLARGIAQAGNTAPTALHYLKLSEACAALQQTAAARQALADGLSRHPASPELLHAEANAHKAVGELAAAEACYRKAAAADPSYVDAEFALAVLLLETRRPVEARQALARALRMKPTYPKALLLLARLEMDAGNMEAAGTHLLPLLKANPGVPEIRQITAQWRLQAGHVCEKHDPAAAERHYRAGLALLPQHAELNASLGVLLLLSGRIPEAVPPLESFQRTQPTNPQAALYLGQAYARTGRLEEARRVLTAGLRAAEQSGQTATAGHLREILTMLGP